MKVIIPMAGQGKRFAAVGIKTPKPLIVVDGLPIIEHIVNNFSEEDEFIFGVNEEHLKTSDLEAVLKRLAPNGKIIAMPYQQAGPIGVLRRIFEEVTEDSPVIVNYCDFSWVWDYEHFKTTVNENDCDGAVVCYRGSHPHLAGPNNYATLDADGLWMKEIREKHSWHQDKRDDWTSSGTHYFKSTHQLKKCCEAIEQYPDWKINGEFYVSQLYQILAQEKLKTYIFEIPTMLQWGTPEDLDEYQYWSDYFRKKNNPSPARDRRHEMFHLTLMAGAGQRFRDAGYVTPKPLIPVDGKPMVITSTESLPQGDELFYITRKDLLNHQDASKKTLSDYIPEEQIMAIDSLTEGQACTALVAKDKINTTKPLLVGACDHGILYDDKAFQEMTSENSGMDALILTFRHFPPIRRNPQSYGWVDAGNDGKVKRVSVKVPPEGDPVNHHALIGAFWFREGSTFVKCSEAMIAANSRINNEFYIDECMNFLIQANYTVHVFECDKYVSWGTPQDLEGYQYWQRFFAAAPFHPYGELVKP